MSSADGKKPKVLVSVLTWNRYVETKRCLESVRALDYSDFETVLVDNRSTDGSFEKLVREFPEIKTARLRSNFGLGEGINEGLRQAMEAKADFLLTLECDGAVDSDLLNRLTAAAEANPHAGLVYPNVTDIYADGKKEYRMSFATDEILKVCPSHFVLSSREIPYAKHLKNGLYHGGFLFVRMSAVPSVGYLDPFYFLYYDELDWQMRLIRAGHETVYEPSARIEHPVSSENAVFEYYQNRNRLYFLAKYAGVHHASEVMSAIVDLCIRALKSLACGEKQKAKTQILALVDFLRSKRGSRDFSQSKASLTSRLAARFQPRFQTVSRKIRFKIKTLLKQKVRIQVYVDWNIGDEIMTSPVYQALKEKYPNSVLDAAVRFPAVLENHPHVDSVNQGKSFKPDLYLDMHREIRHLPRMQYQPHMAGVDSWPAPKIYITESEKEHVRKKFELDNDRLRIAVSPEVWWLARRWPRENWVSVVRHFESKFQAQIFISGTDGPPLGVGIDLVGKTSLREAAALFAQCDLFIGHDSGPLYLAAASGTPSVGLYGPLDPDLLYPPQEKFVRIWTDLECRGCWPDGRMKLRDHCPKVVPDCLPSISVERVIDAAELLLNAGK